MTSLRSEKGAVERSVEAKVELERKGTRGREGGGYVGRQTEASRPISGAVRPDLVTFGVQLGMKYPDLLKIEETRQGSARLLTAMDAWLQSDPKASWKKVVRAIGKKVLAQELEEKYCRDGGSEPPAPRGG